MLGQPQLIEERQTPTILAVDDEEAIVELCARVLKDYTVLKALSGQQALDLLNQQPVDLILTDVMMPGVNGLELLEQVKEDDPDQLVVIMTGFGEKEMILRALKAKADDFIHKPLNLAQLKDTVIKALEKKRLRQEVIQLKQLDRLKTDFLGLISHKLRTPTTSLSLFMQNLSSGAVDLEDPGFASALQSMQQESDYLAKLIQDLLFYSDLLLHDEQLALARHDIKTLASLTLAEKRKDAELKKITLRNEMSGDWPALVIDKQRLRFVLSALLDNAIKFTAPGGKIALSGSVGAKSVTISIRDNGPGIAEDELSKVFEKFYQIDPKNTGQVRGFGLGLFYARQFIGEHHGRIVMDSTLGKGTTVTISLPRPPAAQTP